MTVEGGVDRGRTRSRLPEEDAVIIVRRALKRAEEGQPLFPGEDAEAYRAVEKLEERLARLKARGLEFGDVELSVYARKLLPGSGPLTLAS
ncbi:MAG TPA: hypothetical protein VMZ92_16435 [Planctomycetota bacterium]|nr:hypothetical protein [Planctomycetota bacterium]